MNLYFSDALASDSGSFLAAPQAPANERVFKVNAIRLETYQASAAHSVWFRSLAQKCTKSPMAYFDESKTGGTALMATLLAALVNKRKMDYQAAGFNIIETCIR